MQEKIALLILKRKKTNKPAAVMLELVCLRGGQVWEQHATGCALDVPQRRINACPAPLVQAVEMKGTSQSVHQAIQVQPHTGDG